MGRHPRAGARRLPAVAADPADPRPRPGARPRHPGPHLLQVRGGSPAGSHKPNTAVPQAFYNKAEGITRISTETGAGQWGSAMAFACARFDLECKVYMVRASYDGKPYRRSIMETWGPASPRRRPRRPAPAGPCREGPGLAWPLGIAISEAVEDAATREDTHYALGSVLNHVLLHQTVIGLELKAQLAQAGVEPDVLVACVGGGSNFGGFTFPLLAEKLAGCATSGWSAELTAAPPPSPRAASSTTSATRRAWPC